MTGMNKFDAKVKRQQRRRNHIARDLATPKYHQRVINRKRVDNNDGSFYFVDRYYDEEEETFR